VARAVTDGRLVPPPAALSLVPTVRPDVAVNCLTVNRACSYPISIVSVRDVRHIRLGFIV